MNSTAISIDPSLHPSHAENAQGCRVLVVEDHADTIHVLKILLESRGCKVFSASTVAEALEVLLKESFDVLLCDVGLPDGDGVKLISAIRCFCATPAIALTAYDSPTDVACCLKAGFQKHLGKPVEAELLFAQMQELIGQS